MNEILDVCCGSRMFWFDKKNPSVIFGDNRELDTTLCDGRKLEIKPNILMDFRKIPYVNDFFKLVVFDPPHMKSLGKNSWMAKKYGVLGETWREDLKTGFSECFRVLKDGGILIFKWNESDIKVREILELVNYNALFGHKSGKLQKTHWICFMKDSKFAKKDVDENNHTQGERQGQSSPPRPIKYKGELKNSIKLKISSKIYK